MIPIHLKSREKKWFLLFLRAQACIRIACYPFVTSNLIIIEAMNEAENENPHFPMFAVDGCGFGRFLFWYFFGLFFFWLCLNAFFVILFTLFTMLNARCSMHDAQCTNEIMISKWVEIAFSIWVIQLYLIAARKSDHWKPNTWFRFRANAK